ncbi:hypothetical protein A3H53_00180 [Candidatus Nomurabacteria bacterium RIFCSPLOWO2_02_FULL_40_10]|uniref:Uncharacterized protein n=2 Tax=Candidatus Nomuraibacteriota TaxID=1752729 RepID=A0A1F6Y001_9BACT|nr:MAG: hypothetical protein A2642_01210 [Candidatus Nomurabacteria bacterium RIFCSPHIGHO2_01_FULL_39_10]OGI99674.1 MAG: hypothetical protein A3H53_00180 [Candidatus Nomurabacteria bacterium RIFCSPLOWO2_02_FULL_40_10]
MKTNNQTTIFSTGVFLESVECIINGKKKWRWVATDFEDESFLNGKAINPFEYANKKEKLVEIFKD